MRSSPVDVLYTEPAASDDAAVLFAKVGICESFMEEFDASKAPVAESVVNAPVFGVPFPIGSGAA